MKKLYEKSELAFALVWIGIYTGLQCLANPVNKIIGIECATNAVFNVGLTIVLLCFIMKNNLCTRYGLCKTAVSARSFLWYIPLVIISSHNLWNGIAINFPLADTVCYICHMLCVGFVEEVVFRGFLFKAMTKDSVKSAIIVSSVTFGLGHLLNLFNGSGMGLVSNICQVCGAIAAGFLFVTIFYRSGTLIPCIATHSAIDVASIFANESGLTDGGRILFSLSRFIIIVIYTVILTRTLPKGSKA